MALLIFTESFRSLAFIFSFLRFLLSSLCSNLTCCHFCMSSFRGIRGSIRKPRKLVIRPTRHSYLYFERSSAVTPTNFSLIHTPIIGDRTLFARLVVPVRNANTVPSIFGGVILAKRARVGRVFMAKLITPNMVSVTIIKAMSLI